MDVKPQVEEPELDSPVAIPDAITYEIFKTEDDVKVVEVEEPAPKLEHAIYVVRPCY